VRQVQPKSDTKVTLGTVTQRSGRCLIAGTAMRGDRLLSVVEFDQHSALVDTAFIVFAVPQIAR
jgi:hypothetical protein